MKKRIHWLDLWRGIVILWMLFYHFYYDLGLFGYVSWEQVNSVLGGTNVIISSSFMFISGIASRFSRSNIRRGLQIALCALLVSIGGFVVDVPIWFGILHFFAVATILYGLVGKYLEQMPKYLPPVLYILLYIGSGMLIDTLNPVDSPLRFPFGLMYRGFSSADYYPVFPHIFVFLTGAWCGGFIQELEDGHWLYRGLPSFLTWPGRHSLVIYMLHQPVFYAILSLVQRLR